MKAISHLPDYLKRRIIFYDNWTKIALNKKRISGVKKEIALLRRFGYIGKRIHLRNGRSPQKQVFKFFTRTMFWQFLSYDSNHPPKIFVSWKERISELERT